MDISTLFLIIAIILFLIFFFPDIFPYCSCCNKVKPWLFFRLHKITKLSYGYKGSKSVCKKCSLKYDIKSINDYEKVEAIKKKIDANL